MCTPANPVFIVFEGLDGTGKSTCAKRAAELLGAEYLTTPSESLRGIRGQIIDALKQSQEAQQLFYTATVAEASMRVRELLAAGRSVVLDRYFMSTQVYAEFRGSTLDIERAVGRQLVCPDMTVLLTAPLEIRRQRLLARGCDSSDAETLSEKAEAAILAGYARRIGEPYVGHCLSVDASCPSDDVVAQVLDHVSRKGATK